MKFWDVPIIDAILSVGFTLFILYNVFKNFVSTVRIFLQAKPDNINDQEIIDLVLNLKGVQSVHDTHVWSIDGEKVIFTLHIVIKEGIAENNIILLKSDVRRIGKSFAIDHITVEIEYEKEDCSLENC